MGVRKVTRLGSVYAGDGGGGRGGGKQGAHGQIQYIRGTGGGGLNKVHMVRSSI